jgi:hypothetical protein
MNAIPATIRPEHLDAAMRAADPLIVERRKMEAMRDPAVAGTAARKEQTRLFENAARVRVRRVIAALNGIDIDVNAARWTDPPVILTRAFADRLKVALCNERVVASVEAEIGEEATADLIGTVAGL